MHPRCLCLAAIQWLARLSGLGLAISVAVFALGHGEGGVPNPLDQPPTVAVELGLMLVMTLGLLAAWRWELPAAVATLAALAGFCLVELVARHRLPGPWFALFAVPPVLFVTHALLPRRTT